MEISVSGLCVVLEYNRWIWYRIVLGDGALVHPLLHTDVNKSLKKQGFWGLILGLLDVLKVYHGRCSSCVMSYSESTAGDDFILAWRIYTAG